MAGDGWKIGLAGDLEPKADYSTHFLILLQIHILMMCEFCSECCTALTSKLEDAQNKNGCKLEV